MAPPEVRVVPAEVTTHAGHVDGVSGKVTLAKQAGDAVRPSTDAYGKLCVMVPIMLGALQDVIVGAIDEAAHSLTDTAQRLRTAAGDFTATDQRNAEDIARAGPR
jgi:Excreted virulence factor EspC, type VII ESX diderm